MLIVGTVFAFAVPGLGRSIAIRRSYEEHEGPWVMRFRGDEIITGGESAPMYEWQSPDELRGRYKEYATQE